MQLHVHVAIHHYFDAHAYMDVSVYFTLISVWSRALFYNLLILAFNFQKFLRVEQDSIASPLPPLPLPPSI